jgi:hypothetical protein
MPDARPVMARLEVEDVDDVAAIAGHIGASAAKL